MNLLRLFEPGYLIRRDAERDLVHFIEHFVKGRKNACVLDLGCGSKPYQGFFKECSVKKYTGVDISRSPDVDIVSSIESLPFSSNSFDVIICTQVLEHVKDFMKAVSEMKRVLRPGGAVFCSVPFAYPVHGVPHDYWRFTQHGLEQLFSKFKDATIIAPSGGFYSVLILFNLNLYNLVPFRRLLLHRILYPIKAAMFLFNNLLCLVLDTLPSLKEGDGAFPLNYSVIALK